MDICSKNIPKDCPLRIPHNLKNYSRKMAGKINKKLSSYDNGLSAAKFNQLTQRLNIGRRCDRKRKMSVKQIDGLVQG